MTTHREPDETDTPPWHGIWFGLGVAFAFAGIWIAPLREQFFASAGVSLVVAGVLAYREATAFDRELLARDLDLIDREMVQDMPRIADPRPLDGARSRRLS